MNREITTDVLGFFDVIKIALAKVDNIKKSWIKPSASVKEIHFTHLDRLTDEGKIDFTKNIINATGYYKDNLLRGVQIKQQGGRLGYLPKDIELSFESDEQKRKYFGYKLALMGIEENTQEYAEAEID
jgi:hypothetical protein